MREIRVHRERRAGPPPPQHRDRRLPCWLIENCDPATRALCHAHIVESSCWDFWAASPGKHRQCCHKLDDCRECPVAQRKFAETIPVFVRTALRAPAAPPSGRVIPAVCENLHFLGGAMPSHFDLRRLLRESGAGEGTAFRCRRRGAYLDNSYVSDVCSSRNARDCVFLP